MDTLKKKTDAVLNKLPQILGWDLVSPAVFLAAYFAGVPADVSDSFGDDSALQVRTTAQIYAVVNVLISVSIVAVLVCAMWMATLDAFTCKWLLAVGNIAKCLSTVTLFFIVAQPITPSRDSPVHISTELLMAPVVVAYLLVLPKQMSRFTKSTITWTNVQYIAAFASTVSIVSLSSMQYAYGGHNSPPPLQRYLSILATVVFSVVYLTPTGVPLEKLVNWVQFVLVRCVVLGALTLIVTSVTRTPGSVHFRDFYHIRSGTNMDMLGATMMDPTTNDDAFTTQQAVSIVFVKLPLLVVACVYLIEFLTCVDTLIPSSVKSFEGGKPLTELYTFTVLTLVTMSVYASSSGRSTFPNVEQHTMAPVWVTIVVAVISAVVVLSY